MRFFYITIISLFIVCVDTLTIEATDISTENFTVSSSEGWLNVNADILLDRLNLGVNKQIFITPVVRGGENKEVILPSILVNGRNMHYAISVVP